MILLFPAPWVLMRYLKHKLTQQEINAPTIRFPQLQRLQKAFANTNFGGHYATKWMKYACIAMWCCFVLSLMRPELVNNITHSKNVGYDLMLAVDLSRSMDIADFINNGKPVSRIAATKKVVSNFVQQRQGDRVGLIVFAEQAFLTIPLTLDITTVSKLLNNLVVGMAGERTAIGDAIGIGVQNLRKRPAASRVLILLTDGEDTASRIPPLEAAKIAANDHIKIYTIGVGDKLDEDLLEKISKMTDGTYFKVTNVDALEQVYGEIDKLEKTEARQHRVLISKPLYTWFLIPALMLFAIIYLHNARQYGYRA